GQQLPRLVAVHRFFNLQSGKVTAQGFLDQVTDEGGIIDDQDGYARHGGFSLSVTSTAYPRVLANTQHGARRSVQVNRKELAPGRSTQRQRVTVDSERAGQRVEEQLLVFRGGQLARIGAR